MTINAQPTAYDDFCKCGHRNAIHLEADTNYAPCSVEGCSCDDFDEETATAQPLTRRINNWLDNRSEDARVGIYFLTGAVIAAVFVGLVFVGASLSATETRARNEVTRQRWQQVEQIVGEARARRELAAKTKAGK